jgi:putative DNA primase/helicase
MRTRPGAAEGATKIKRPSDFNDMKQGGRGKAKLRLVRECLAAAEAPAPAETPDVATYQFTESEVARRFGDIVRGRALYAADEGVWYCYDGARWVRDHGGVKLLEWSLEVSRAYAEDAARFGSADPNFQARVATAKTYNGLAGRKRVIELVRAEPGLSILASQFDADPMLLNCLNGTIDLQTGELRPHNPADRQTKLVPVAYDPAAKCSWLDRVLKKVVSDKETIPWLAKAVGYSATGDCTERAAFFLYGPTGGGKSLLVETIQGVLGDYGVLAPTSLLLEKRGESHPCDVITLRGRRMASFPELPRGRRFDLPTFKTLTGNDTLTGRGMRENFATFRPTAKLWMTGNNKPIVSDPDNSTWVRMRVIPIEKSIPEDRQDKHLLEKLLQEAPGILAWIVRGALAWQREGLGTPVKVRAATDAYKHESDRLAPFIGERCELAPGKKVSRRDLRSAYETWCAREGERAISPRDFAEQLRQRDVTETKLKQGGEAIRGWRGIGLLAGGQVDTGGHQIPDRALGESSRDSIPDLVTTGDHLTTPSLGGGKPSGKGARGRAAKGYTCKF